MKPNTAEPSIFETTRKHRHLQILSTLESAVKKPWGLSDEKTSPNNNVNLLSSLASNIHKFQVKRRVKKNSCALKRNEGEGNEEKRKEKGNSNDKEESFRDLIQSYKRRIQMLVNNQLTHRGYEEENHSKNQLRIQLESQRSEVLTARRTHRINNIEVKFLPSNGSKQKKSPSLGESLGQKILNQIRMKILSRRQTIRKDTELKSQRSIREDSCQESKENIPNKDTQMHSPLMNISKIFTNEIRERQSKQLRIFDLQHLRKINQSKPVRGDSFENLEENSVRLRRTRKPGWMSDRQSCEILMPR